MLSNARRVVYFASALLSLMLLDRPHAQAIPIFAQRYHLECKACHSVLPVLNSFGENFRQHGYQLPAEKHGTTVVAVRYQLEWEKDPVNARRWTEGGVLLANLDVGRIAAFIHYNLGSQGGPAGLYLAFLTAYNEHTQTEYRGGLFELPLLQSPGQRLDDLQQYGYYGIHVGLNDLPLSSPRWGAWAERSFGASRVDFVVDDGEFKGAAYGGAPTPTGETTWAAHPEVGLWARTKPLPSLTVGGALMEGSRHIVLTGKPGFDDAYTRDALFLQYQLKRFQLTGEQWWGHDQNADGFGTAIGSSGGYVRALYATTPHSYLAIRYDASANPFLARDFVYYGAFMVTPHVRFILQDVQTVGSTSALGGAFTVAFPWPAKL